MCGMLDMVWLFWFLVILLIVSLILIVVAHILCSALEFISYLLPKSASREKQESELVEVTDVPESVHQSAIDAFKGEHVPTMVVHGREVYVIQYNSDGSYKVYQTHS